MNNYSGLFDSSVETVEMPAVEYVRPNGRRVHHTVEVPKALEDQVLALRERGCWLAGEVLTTGQVSLTIEHKEGDFDGILCPNGPEVQEATETLIGRFDAERFDRWLREVSTQ